MNEPAAAPRREAAAGAGTDAELLLMFADVICPRLRDLLVPHGASATNWDDAAKQLRGIAAALSTAERDAKRWRFARTILHVVSTGPSGGYYLTSDVADGMDVQAVSPDGFVDQFAAARVPSGGET